MYFCAELDILTRRNNWSEISNDKRQMHSYGHKDNMTFFINVQINLHV